MVHWKKVLEVNELYYTYIYLVRKDINVNVYKRLLNFTLRYTNKSEGIMFLFVFYILFTAGSSIMRIFSYWTKIQWEHIIQYMPLRGYIMAIFISHPY
jgi:hypothetical protein